MRSFFITSSRPVWRRKSFPQAAKRPGGARSDDLLKAIDVPGNQPNRGDMQAGATQYLIISSECAAAHADIADGFAFKPI
jgi:hypothetical protein